jgi:hypothetical protein
MIKKTFFWGFKFNAFRYIDLFHFNKIYVCNSILIYKTFDLNSYINFFLSNNFKLPLFFFNNFFYSFNFYNVNLKSRYLNYLSFLNVNFKSLILSNFFSIYNIKKIKFYLFFMFFFYFFILNNKYLLLFNKKNLM